MIVEIRDLETAQIAVQASLTGHLVLATLHTNDAASAVTRLTDMGYAGRRGVYELLLIDETIRSLIHRNAADAEILEAGRAQGMRTLREDSERWLASGLTSLEEVIRVTGGA
ncbi:type II secretory ATPase GspE/PulE/Tfp pilus assembly ATPase PilB-like protein [Paraburkholderia sp. JPY465]